MLRSFSGQAWGVDKKSGLPIEDGRYTTWAGFQHQHSPVSGLFFDDVDWGVCGAIRQFSNDSAVTDALLEDLYDGTVEVMVETAAALNKHGQVWRVHTF